jgi:hypothetical protein
MGTAVTLARTAADQRQIVKAFRAARAMTGATARRLRDLGLNDSGPLRRMVLSTIIRRAGPERYFLDEAVWSSRRRLKGRTVLRIALALGVGVAALFVARM